MFWPRSHVQIADRWDGISRDWSTLVQMQQGGFARMQLVRAMLDNVPCDQRNRARAGEIIDVLRRRRVAGTVGTVLLREPSRDRLVRRHHVHLWQCVLQ